MHYCMFYRILNVIYSVKNKQTKKKQHFWQWDVFISYKCLTTTTFIANRKKKNCTGTIYLIMYGYLYIKMLSQHLDLSYRHKILSGVCLCTSTMCPCVLQCPFLFSPQHLIRVKYADIILYCNVLLWADRQCKTVSIQRLKKKCVLCRSI